jgi:radical SAM-linked protein
VVDSPAQQAPPVQRLRIRYAKRGRLRFTSHRDFGRAFERAMSRAALPVAYSSGFSPHPRISYAGAAPTGASSEAEYLELGLREVCEPQAVRAALDAALPAGLDILDVVVARTGTLADRMEAAHWQLELPGVCVADAAAAVRGFLDQPYVEVQRMTKKGLRTFDCRAAVVRLVVRGSAAGDPTCAILDLVVRHGTPSVRPDDVLAGLRETTGLTPPEAPHLLRLAQGPLDQRSGTVGDPLDVDRDASSQ